MSIEAGASIDLALGSRITFGTLRPSTYRRLLILGVLFAAALGIRLYHINEPPLRFHATRQYRSLLIARSYYLDSQSSVPRWMKQIADISRQRQGMLEPPILPFLVSLGYRLVGGEHFWIPQFLSSMFWLIGGGFLYLIACRLTDGAAALFATAFYLLLPFAVVASRSFQPDPLMIMLLLASILAVLHYHESPSSLRLGAAAITAAGAFLIKPVCLFTILGAFVAPAIARQGVWRGLVSRDTLCFTSVMLLPTLGIYLYGLWTGRFLVGEAEKTLLPELWASRFFWRSWLTNIEITVGWGSFLGGLLGTLLLRQGLPFALLIGLWTGYAIFGLVFNYNLATHDYYQLQLIPIVALSLGQVATLVLRELRERQPGLVGRLPVGAILLLALYLALAVARGKLDTSGAAQEVRRKEEIGNRVDHSSRTIFLSADYGVPLEYHGLLSGFAWPIASDLEWEQLAGQRGLDAGERFEEWFAKYSPEYFIVEDLQEFEHQTDLKRFLTSRFPIIAQSPDYLIFGLSHGVKGAGLRSVSPPFDHRSNTSEAESSPSRVPLPPT
jgi:4-amino-4-deoxy-L-arabinose transferase-like glycosyltransferase